MKTLTLVSVPVTDQQRAKEFYLKFGFEIVVEAPMGPDQTWLQMRLPDNNVSITLVNWFDKMPAGSMQGMVIQVDDIVKTAEELEVKGITVAKIDQTPWGKFASVTDPDGNSLSLHQE
ncbi:MAG: glyoxalase [Bacteroidetes bacterium]|nr:glyoxalase [Bacteroidota bacterium]